ncbi:HupE/UreJ family protein [Nocardia yamanashiensis]|uniref:HupE/UreJ family protein n=1 Tax=Nocardia yamanashiensis TaxID=209247 RepID=UPI0008319A12|nr:HupE/UreJ family protein [Nocardia yamanashiensis]
MTRTLRIALIVLGCAVLALLCNPNTAPAQAHPMPGTNVFLDVRETAIEAELLIPTMDLAEASGIRVDLRTRLSDTESTGLATYLHDHLRPATSEGAPWSVRITDLRLDYTDRTATGPDKELVAHAVLTPPAGAGMRHFALTYDAVMHKVVTHTAIVAVRQDWQAGQVESGNAARQIGVLRVDAASMTVPPLSVDLTDAGAWRGFAGMVVLGGHHILEGTDHLLFLFTLLLPAVLIAKAGRWYPDRRAGRAVRHIVAVTIAFTIGHSVALVLSALTRLDLPARPIETLIAATILVGGAHAIRPLFPGREALVAGVFGLVHGMAFAFTLAELKLSTGQLALSVLGFNLGIEAVQLLLVALALPPLLVLAATRAQPVLRVGAALLVILAALGWACDRLGFPNPVARIADQTGTSILPIILSASAIAAVVLAVQRTRARQRKRTGNAVSPRMTGFGYHRSSDSATAKRSFG